MFEKVVTAARSFFDALRPRDPELKPGVITDTLSQESFPARESVAASLDLDTSHYLAISSMSMPVIPCDAVYRLRLREQNGKEREVLISETQRQELLEKLRDEVGMRGYVQEVPLPRFDRR